MRAARLTGAALSGMLNGAKIAMTGTLCVPQDTSMSQLPVSPALLADLDRVEQIILERVQPRLAVIRAAGQHILTSGGKRIRAALTLLAAQLGEYTIERVLHSAAAVELIHAASLVHDDLVDQTARRRGEVTVHTRWDGDVALMVGDYFFALAAAEMALAPDPRIIGYFSRGVMTICEGELSPVMNVTPLDVAMEQYLYKIGCKTAALFEAGCKAGMVCGGDGRSGPSGPPAVAWKSVHDSHNRRTSQGGKPLPPVRGPLNRWSSAPAGRCRPGPGTPGRCAGTPPFVRGRPR